MSAVQVRGFVLCVNVFVSSNRLPFCLFPNTNTEHTLVDASAVLLIIQMETLFLSLTLPSEFEIPPTSSPLLPDNHLHSPRLGTCPGA